MDNSKSFDISFNDVGFFALNHLLKQKRFYLKFDAFTKFLKEVAFNAQHRGIKVSCNTSWSKRESFDELIKDYFKTIVAKDGTLIVYIKKQNTNNFDFQKLMEQNTNIVSQEFLKNFSSKNTLAILDGNENILEDTDKTAIMQDYIYPGKWINETPEERQESNNLVMSIL